MMFAHHFKNYHCRNYEPLAFDRGYCRMRETVVLAQGAACQYFDRLPRCQHCQNYASSEAGYMGVCQALKRAPMTFPDMLGAACEHFDWRVG